MWPSFSTLVKTGGGGQSFKEEEEAFVTINANMACCNWL
jgi:hypothetical protein